MSNRAKTFLLIMFDLFLLFLALTITLVIRESDNISQDYLFNHYRVFSYIFGLWILIFFIEGIYSLKTYNPATLPISLLRGTTFSAIVSATCFYLIPVGAYKITPKTNLILMAIIALILLYIWRRYFFVFFSSASRQRDTLIIGSQETLDLVQNEINHKPYLGYKIIAAKSSESSIDFESLKELQLIAIERKTIHNESLYKQIFALLSKGVEIIDLASFAEKISGKIPIQSIDESWFIEYCGHKSSRSYDLAKNMLDRFVALILLICCIPLAAILLPILLVLQGRPLFFKQTRTGLNNSPFTLYKLRTMVVNAEKDGAQWAKPKDARITPVGKFLRKSRLDELPQLLNIFRGEMSLVGPRPERPEMIVNELAPKIPYYNLRHLVKPGVTGWAQVTFRYGFSTEDAKEKLQYDLYYVKNRSLWLDFVVFIKTIKTVLTGAGQ